MNIPDNAVIWRDPVTPDAFHVGTRVRGKTCWWLSFCGDAIDECFGADAYAIAHKLTPGQPVPLADVLVCAKARARLLNSIERALKPPAKREQGEDSADA